MFKVVCLSGLLPQANWIDIIDNFLVVLGAFDLAVGSMIVFSGLPFALGIVFATAASILADSSASKSLALKLILD